MSEETRAVRLRVAARISVTYALLTLAFTLVAGWSVRALRNSASEAEQLRSGYLPLTLVLRDAVADQDAWNAQLNHITTASNPADKRAWFDAAISGARPRTFAKLRLALHRAFPSEGGLGRELMDETTDIEKLVADDPVTLDELFSSLARGDATRAEARRADLVTRGNRTKVRLSSVATRMERAIDQVLDEARARERLALRLLVALTAAGLLVGALTALYARRVLAPLGAVTARAQAVARGDLTPRAVVAGQDEIGELAVTFERMVAAIGAANEQLIQSERLAAIGKMAAHVTHEIRNPLSSMALNVELLEDELATLPSDEARVLLRAIKAEIERLTALSSEYLSVARQRPLDLGDEDLADVVREACEFVRPELVRAAVDLRIDVGADLPTVRIDEAQIKQALFNLVRNAREAMPSGGKLDVRVVGATQGGVDVLIEDEGTGVAEEAREALFQPFFTTKGHGTGLGLAITRQIIEAHGGEIGCEARAPRGTRFRLHLPAA